MMLMSCFDAYYGFRWIVKTMYYGILPSAWRKRAKM